LPIDADVALYWTSLGLSAAGVVLFLWLMRERRDRRRESEIEKRESKPTLTEDRR
jgi:hypothetical protein